MTLLTFIILIILLAIANGYIDYRLFKHPDYRINHSLEAVIRGITIALLTIWLKGFSIASVFAFMAGAFIFSIVFEITFNLLRHTPVLFVGTTAKSDIFIRKYFPHPVGLFYLIFKLCIVGLFIYLLNS